MIDRAAFENEIAILAEMYRHEISGPTIDRYHELLSPSMTTAQFCRACRHLALTPGGFWPKPSEFLPPMHERLSHSQLLDAARREAFGPPPPAPLRLGAPQ